MELKELEALLHDELVDNRLQAARCLSQLDGLVEPLFVQALGDEDWRVRKEAIGYYLQQPDASKRTDFVADLLSNPENAGLRNAAIEILISLGAQVIEVLLERLEPSDVEVRKFIVDILGEIGHSACAIALLPYLKDQDENVRYAVVETIGKLRSADAVGALLDLLETSEAGLQFTIFEALATIGQGVPVARILPYAQNVLLRKSVFSCLGQLGSAEAIPVLLDGLSDPLRKNREVALLAFARLIKSLPVKDCPEVDPQSEQVVDLLLSYLQHEKLEFRSAACYVLSLFPDAKVVEEILGLLAEEELRADVVAAAQLIPRPILTSLISGVRLEDENTVFLIYLLGELGCAEIGPLAMEGVKSENPQLRYVSAMALGKIRSLTATPLLSDLLADDVSDIREAASEALCTIGRDNPPEMIKTVTPYLESPDATLRLLAVKTLGALPVDSIENYLLLALKDVASEVRCEALRGLSGHQSQRLLSGLSLALTDEVADVRRLAAIAIGAFPAQRSIPILELALDDSEPWVRMEAVRAVRDGDEQALLTIVKRALTDEVGLVVIAGLETAHQLLHEKAVPLLRDALMHEDEDVVSTAVVLLLSNDYDAQLLNHSRSLVRLRTVSELQRFDDQRWLAVFESQLVKEQDPQVRQALEDALRKGRVRS